MANNWKGEVELEAGGRKLLFRLGVNEMIELQGDFGLADKDEEFATALRNLSGFKRHRDAIFRGLQLHQPDVTLKQAGDVMNEIGMAQVGELIAKALVLAFPEENKQEGGEPRPSVGPTSS
jgi:hypothetical protein